MPDIKLPDIPTIEQLKDNVLQFLQEAFASGDNSTVEQLPNAQLQRSNNRVLAFAFGAGMEGQYQYVRDHVAQQGVPIWSTGEVLDGWLESFGLHRKAAVAATGSVQVTLNASTSLGLWIEVGTLFTLDGLTYSATQLSRIHFGAFTTIVPVQCMTAGAIGNIPSGSTLILSTPSVTVVAAGDIDGGQGEESDEDAAARLKHRLSNPPMGGAPADYEAWAMQVSGITRALGVRAPDGAGTVKVIIMADNNADKLPTAQQVQDVEDYILARCPPVTLTVTAPTIVLVDITLTITPDTDETRAAVTQELEDLFTRESEFGKDMPHSHITEAISIAAGETNHNITSPVITQGGSEVASATANEILTLGTITFS